MESQNLIYVDKKQMIRKSPHCNNNNIGFIYLFILFYFILFYFLHRAPLKLCY